MQNGYQISNIEQIDSPALVVYPAKAAANIQQTVDMAGDVNKLRPHVKTCKMREVCNMMLQAGISKYKCATIAEAEMLAMLGSVDVLLAYQPVGPKIIRLLNLAEAYPFTHFSCLIDCETSATAIHEACRKKNITLDVFIDLNVGMNRTGIIPGKAAELISHIRRLPNLRISGLHGYDGHIHDENPLERKKAADISFEKVRNLYLTMQPSFTYPLTMVMGGTPTFPVHINRPDCECSPGTFVFWDWGYKQMMKELPFEYAALVVSRLISTVDEHHICVDLGYKSVAAESPLPRVHFLNAPEAVPSAQSEEHLVLKVPDSSKYAIGDVFYGVPRHICPTVALYEKAFVIENNEMKKTWHVIARNRIIKY
ncbi:MAG: D-TA family PLP-dependent enzyme [Tannerella sp.]|nr:D-TA family PLP-dependent enzyme [Tannerella sp.]